MPCAGERRRKSVRGCVISSDLSVLNLKIVKKGEQELPGITDEEKPRMRGPKRASRIRKLFNLTKVRVASVAEQRATVPLWQAGFGARRWAEWAVACAHAT